MKLGRFCEAMEAAVRELKAGDPIGFAEDYLINTAARAEWIAADQMHWLTGDGLSAPPKDRVAAQAMVLKATKQRDSTLAALGITSAHGSAKSIFDVHLARLESEATDDDEPTEGSDPQ